MICVDTTFLVDLWRERDLRSSAARALLGAHAGEEVAVPAHAAGEFLEGGAAVSGQRLDDSLEFLRLFRIGEVGIETALRYARIVAHLRQASELSGRSKPDLWIAAWAVEHSSRLATRNVRHFEGIPGVELLAYG
ncbi:MAG TPA: type II toxin-antitoxin system VapC family toxin [Thermoanaerobaculia bacterium]|nr:type II toxin-antitoxin system VapC family toxin [Thermoanaerobaculia bacterium]